MVLLVSFVITLVLVFLELSLGHYFLIFGTGAYVTLAFLASLAIRSRNYFQVVLAFVAGVFFDFASIYSFPLFTTVFLLVMLAGRTVFYQKTSYKTLNSFIVLLLVSTLLLSSASLPILVRNDLVGWQNFVLTISVNLILTLSVGLILYRLLEPYYNWLDKKTEK